MPQRIGKFEILDELGHGAMGTVYRARDPHLDRLVALKTVAHGLLSKGEALERFQREARAAARLQHPNIVTIYELGEVEGTLYIAMELLAGMDLAQAMAPHDRLTLKQKLQLIVDTCRGLDFAHKHGVVHRDVKPANIRILLDGSVKIVDFGIARLEDSSLTQTGLMLGTPSYMAPEVLAGGRIDHRADMWATGVVLYELLSGRLPFESPTIASLVYKIVHAPAPALDAARLGLPPGLMRVIERALAKDPGQRYRDMAQMAEDLLAVMGLGGAPESPEAPSHPSPAPAQTLVQTRVAPTPAVAPAPDSAAEPAPAHRTDASLAAGATPVAGEARGARLPTAVLTELRVRGASVFRELATFGEPPAVSAAVLSPIAGRDLLATSGSDGAIRIWDLQTRTRALTLRTALHQRSGHDALATALAFSADGALLASGHVDGSVHLWDVAGGQEAPARLRHDASVGTLAFSPDGATLASGGMDANLKLWDVKAALGGDTRRELHRQPSAVSALAYAGAGAWLVTGHANRILRVLDARSGRLKATLRGPEALVSLLCVAPDQRHVAVVSQDRTIRLFDLVTQKEVGLLSGHRKPVTSLSFFSDGKHLVSVALENVVQLWDVEARATLAALWGPTDESFAGVALYAGGDHIAVALSDGRIRLWGPAQ